MSYVVILHLPCPANGKRTISPDSIVIFSVLLYRYFRLFCQIVSFSSLAQNSQYFCRKKIISTTLKNKVMKVKPLADRVLVKPAEAEEKTLGGIIIPDSAKEKPLKGEVIATGNGTKDEEMVLKEGDKVLYGKYAGTEIELDGEKFLIMRQSDVLAII
jgi:chaperonin GroES